MKMSAALKNEIMRIVCEPSSPKSPQPPFIKGGKGVFFSFVSGQPAMGYSIEIPLSCPPFSNHPPFLCPYFQNLTEGGAVGRGRSQEHGIIKKWKVGRMEGRKGYDLPILSPSQYSKLPLFRYSSIPLFPFLRFHLCSKNSLQPGELIDRINYGQ